MIKLSSLLKQSIIFSGNFRNQNISCKEQNIATTLTLALTVSEKWLFSSVTKLNFRLEYQNVIINVKLTSDRSHMLTKRQCL